MGRVLRLILAVVCLHGAAARAEDFETMRRNLRMSSSVAEFERLAVRYYTDDAATASRALRDSWTRYVQHRPQFEAALIWLPRLRSANAKDNSELLAGLTPLCRTSSEWTSLFGHSYDLFGPQHRETAADTTGRVHGYLQRALATCRSLGDIRDLLAAHPRIEPLVGGLATEVIAARIARDPAFLQASENPQEVLWALARFRSRADLPEALLERAAVLVRGVEAKRMLAAEVAQSHGDSPLLRNFLRAHFPSLTDVLAMRTAVPPIGNELLRRMFVAGIAGNRDFLKNADFVEHSSALGYFSRTDAYPAALVDSAATAATDAEELLRLRSHVTRLRGDAAAQDFLVAVLPRMMALGPRFNTLTAHLQTESLPAEVRTAFAARAVKLALAVPEPQLERRFRALLTALSAAELTSLLGAHVDELATNVAQPLDAATRFRRLRALLAALAEAGAPHEVGMALAPRIFSAQRTAREFLEAVSYLDVTAQRGNLGAWVRRGVSEHRSRFVGAATVEQINHLVWESGLYPSTVEKEQVLRDVLRQWRSFASLEALRVPSRWARSPEFDAELTQFRADHPELMPAGWLATCLGSLGVL